MLIDGQPVFEQHGSKELFNVILAFYGLPLSVQREIIVENLAVMPIEEYCNTEWHTRIKIAFRRIAEKNLVDKLRTLVYAESTKQ